MTMDRNSPRTLSASPIRITGQTMEELRRELQGINPVIDLLAQSIEDHPYVEIPPWIYDEIPPSTSTITFNYDFSNGTILDQIPILYVQSDTPAYGLLKTIASGLWTVQGAPLDTSAAIQHLYIGYPSLVVVKHYFIDGTYGTVVEELLENVHGEYDKWDGQNAYLVHLHIRHRTDAATTQPFVNFSINGNNVSTDAGGNGLQAAAGSWTDNSDVGIDTTYYQITHDDAIGVECTATGVGNASDLTVHAVFVYENRDLGNIMTTVSRL